MQMSAVQAKTVNLTTPKATGRCVCGDVKFEIDYPAFWAWHDHSDASRRAHGCAYATLLFARVFGSSNRVMRSDPCKTRNRLRHVPTYASALASGRSASLCSTVLHARQPSR